MIKTITLSFQKLLGYLNVVASAVQKGLDFKITSICCLEKLLNLKSFMKHNVIK